MLVLIIVYFSFALANNMHGTARFEVWYNVHNRTLLYVFILLKCFVKIKFIQFTCLSVLCYIIALQMWPFIYHAAMDTMNRIA